MHSDTINELLRQGLLAYLSGQPLPALDCYDLILEHHPGEARALLGKGRALLMVGRREAAFSCFSRAVTDTLEAEARYGMALCHFLQPDLGRGIRQLQALHAAGKLEALPPEVQLPREPLERALRMLEQGRARAPDAGWLLTAVALLWRGLGRNPEAFGALAEALRQKPAFPPALLLRESWLSRSLCLPAPEDPSGGTAARDTAPSGNLDCLPEKVVRAAQELLLDLDPRALVKRAQHCAEHSRWDEAAEYLRRLMIVEPDHAEGCRLRVEVFLAGGQQNEAREECFHLMDLCERGGHIAEALEAGAWALDLWPEHERPLLKHVLLFHRLQDVRTTTRWALALVDHYRFVGELDRAAATLHWLLRKPLPPRERREARLTLVEVLLDADRPDHALEQLRAHLRREAEPCDSLARLLARLPEDWAERL